MTDPTPIDDGGPVFPKLATKYDEIGGIVGVTLTGGMSVHDLYVGLALISVQHEIASIDDHPGYSDDELGRRCHAIADAMIAARREKNDE